MKYPAYCPHHLGIHHSAWCTAGDHVPLDANDPAACARRMGLSFYHGDVTFLRDSADNPCIGDVVGDRRAYLDCYGFHLAYMREVLAIGEDTVAWKRPHAAEGKVYTCSRATWRRWALGSWRCNPDNGKPTNNQWKPR